MGLTDSYKRLEKCYDNNKIDKTYLWTGIHITFNETIPEMT
jgi:hypothetical protein